jgi:MFS family permease
MKNSFIKVLENRDFKKMWFSQLFSQIALNMLIFGSVLHIFEITGKATSISLVMVASAIPVAIFGPFSGVLADKVDYRKILIYTNILRVVAIIFILLSTRNILALLEVIFIVSALSQIFSPAESAAIPLVVPKKQLVNANSTVMTTTFVTILIGYCAAGPLLSLLGAFWLFAICGILFIFASLATFMLSNFDTKVVEKLTITKFATGIEHVWHEMKTGLHYVTDSKDILRPMVRLTIGWTIFGSLITILPAFSASVLKIDPKLIAPLVVAPAGVGMFLATILLNKKTKVSMQQMNNGFLFAGITMLIFSFYFLYSHFFLAIVVLLILAVIFGYGTSLIQIPGQTLLHLNSEQDKRGRVFGMSTMMLRLATTLPSIVIGGVSDLTSPLITMMLLAVVTTIYAVILMFE